MKSKTAASLALIAIVSSGCYTRTPLTSPAPEPSAHIVATLTDSGTVAMGSALGSGAVAIEGVVTSVDNDAWRIEMLRVDHRDGRTIDWNHEPVVFRPSTLVNTNVVKLDKKKSWLAAGGIVIGAYVLARTFNLIGAPDEDNSGEEPQQTRIPIGPR